VHLHRDMQTVSQRHDGTHVIRTSVREKYSLQLPYPRIFQCQVAIFNYNPDMNRDEDPNSQTAYLFRDSSILMALRLRFDRIRHMHPGLTLATVHIHFENSKQYALENDRTRS